jgi:acyl-CoA reductase-like NAD-dependent aldehyde dehydrogenase
MNQWVKYSSCLIDGASFRASASGEEVSSIDPFNGEVRWSASAADTAAVDTAVFSARSAQSAWSKVSLDERLVIMRRGADQTARYQL